jgi:hypothetical protein
VAHVQTATRPEAEAVHRRLVRGESLPDLARTLSIDAQTKDQSGVLAWVTASSGVGHLGTVPHVNSAVMGLKKGGISEVLETPGGYSVFVAVDRTEEQMRPYDDALRDAVAKRVQTRKHNDLYNGLLERLRKEYDVEFYQENFDKYARTLLDEPGLFAGFPESVRAAQAQFMIGFLEADERKEFGSARKAFESFLTKYPDHELASSARWMLENMEKANPDPVQLQDLRKRVRR